jgi:putative peptidoglycan lipid II flippase
LSAAELSRRSVTARGASADALVANSVSGALWTAVSRLSGLAQTLTVGAILGATYLGNTYQSINSLPNIVYYQLLSGSLFASILVPPLVHHLDAGDAAGARRLARGFLGTLLVLAVALALVLLAAGPLILHALTIDVAEPAAAAAARRIGLVLLAIFVPQVVLYTVAGTGAAVMNADGRFALAAGAQTVENLGMIVTLLLAGAIFGTANGITSVPPAEILLLGLGTTTAVALHTGCQWFGARTSGIVLAPSRGWRDPAVREVLARVPPTLAYTGLAAAQVFGVLVVADRVRGGLVAFQFGMNFFYLPAAVVTWPIARAALPQLARLERAGDHVQMRVELFRATGLAAFVTIPAAVAYLVLAPALARAVTFGNLATQTGVSLVTASIASIALAVIGDGAFILATYACYARKDARTPLRSMLLRTGITLGCLAAAWGLGLPVLPTLGLSLSVGSLAGAAHLWRAVLRGARVAHPDPSPLRLRRSLARTGLASITMAPPALLVAAVLGRTLHGQVGEALAFAGAALVGAVVYLGVQRATGAEELSALRDVVLRRGIR